MAASGHLSAMPPEAFAAAWACHSISTARIAERLGVSPAALHWRARSLGLPRRPTGPQRAKKCSDDLFRRMWMAGVSTPEIARECGYSRYPAASHRARLLGLPRRVRRSGSGGPAGWPPTITMAQFRELEFRRMMDNAAVSAPEAIAGAASSGRLSLDAIVAQEAARADLLPGDIIGPSRLKHIVAARTLAMIRAREAGYSMIAIGRYLGGRDPSTVRDTVALALRRAAPDDLREAA